MRQAIWAVRTFQAVSIDPRLIHEISFPMSLSRGLLERSRFDGVMAFCPLLGSVAFAALRKTLYREPLWINIQDIPAEASLASGINKSRLLHRIGSWAQKFLFRRGEVWSSISPEMVQRLESMQGADTIVQHVPNWLTGSLAEQISELPAKQCTSGDTTKLLYSGTIGKKQGLLEFCQQLQRCQRPFQFEIRGEGSEAAPVRNWIDDVRDSRFRFGGLLPERQFVERMHRADWFVISETPNAGFSFLPSKLIPCISVGTPVLAIAGDSSPLAHEVSEHGLGHVIRWSELGQLQDRSDIWQAADQCELRRNCLQRASDFNRDVAIDRIEELLLEFAERRNVIRVGLCCVERKCRYDVIELTADRPSCTVGYSPAKVASIIYLAPDCTDSAVRKRVEGLLELGHQLTTFAFRRDRYNVGRPCPWDHVELGKSRERHLVSRLLFFWQALWIIYGHRARWRESTIIWARNLDLALLGLMGRLITRCSRAHRATRTIGNGPVDSRRGGKADFPDPGYAHRHPRYRAACPPSPLSRPSPGSLVCCGSMRSCSRWDWQPRCPRSP